MKYLGSREQIPKYVDVTLRFLALEEHKKNADLGDMFPGGI